MNERIKELIKQACIEVPHGREWDVTFEYFDKEKFAEMIVRECIAQCWSVSELEHKGDVISECSKRMRKHFGVEG